MQHLIAIFSGLMYSGVLNDQIKHRKPYKITKTLNKEGRNCNILRIITEQDASIQNIFFWFMYLPF
jgi:hypothetical protein